MSNKLWSIDSRSVEVGQPFIALSSDQEQRLQHLEQARARGASLLYSEDDDLPGVTSVLDARWTYAREHAAALGLQVRAPIVGVTGTDGKTTVTHMTHHCLGLGAARIGTLGYHDGQQAYGGTHTTPPVEQLHTFLAKIAADCPGIAMELSSQGLDQERCAALDLHGLVWTGLGRDHLDYHGTQAAYLEAKLRAMRLLRPGSLVVVAAHCRFAHVVVHAAQARQARVVRLGFDQGDVRVLRESEQWRLRSAYVDAPLPVPLPGRINAWNAGAAALLASAAGVPLSTALARLATCLGVPGRLERVGPRHYVDYAHTPAALEMSLEALRGQAPQLPIVLVFGCGGDRDRGKRAPMGHIAARLAWRTIITTDNSRGEDPLAIARDIVAGLPATDDATQWGEAYPLLIELDRAQAIRRAVQLAGHNAQVLIAGKGHEQEQIIGRERRPWDDRTALREQLAHEGQL